MLTGNTTDEPPRRRLAPPRVRPNKYHEEGQGRKTGWRPPPNLPKDEFGFENFDDYLRSDEEEAHDEVAAGPFMPFDQLPLNSMLLLVAIWIFQRAKHHSTTTKTNTQPQEERASAIILLDITMGHLFMSMKIPRPSLERVRLYRAHQCRPVRTVLLMKNLRKNARLDHEQPLVAIRKCPLCPSHTANSCSSNSNLNHRRETMAPRVVYQDRYYDDNSSRYPDNKYFDQQAQEYEDEPLDLEDLDSRRRQQYPQPRGPHDQRQLVVSSRSRTSTPNSRTAQQYSPNHRVESPILRQTVHSQPRSQQPRYLPRYEEPAEEYSYEDDNSDANVHRASPVNGGKYPQPFARAVSAAAASATRQLAS
ncbi:hypothetical protein BDR26DRAFT_891877 [Obelidium mucronatum]|nr:hypothetical protein BDR26DRAFT_891877 [Obelidium mucronatum]